MNLLTVSPRYTEQYHASVITEANIEELADTISVRFPNTVHVQHGPNLKLILWYWHQDSELGDTPTSRGFEYHNSGVPGDVVVFLHTCPIVMTFDEFARNYDVVFGGAR